VAAFGVQGVPLRAAGAAAMVAAAIVTQSPKRVATSLFRLELLKKGKNDSSMVAVAGFLTQGSDLSRMWEALDAGDAHKWALRWEAKHTIDFLNTVAGAATTMGVELMCNPWQQAKRNAEKAGCMLAEALRGHACGRGPVCMIGHSLGARVVFCALEDLARTGHTNIVKHVVLMGAALPACTSRFSTAQRAVMGRFVNLFSPEDKVLTLLYRAFCTQRAVAGINPVSASRVCNVDVSRLLSGAQWGHNYAESLALIMGQVRVSERSGEALIGELDPLAQSWNEASESAEVETETLAKILSS